LAPRNLVACSPRARAAAWLVGVQQHAITVGARALGVLFCAGFLQITRRLLLPCCCLEAAAACCGMATGYSAAYSPSEVAAQPVAEQHHAAAGSEVDDFGDDVDFSDSTWDDDAADVAAAGGAVAGGAAAGRAAAATRTAAGSAAAPGVPRNNAHLKHAARAAFAGMGLDADSRIPPAQVLARDPAAASGGRDRCPPALWVPWRLHRGGTQRCLAQS
jgi:hypothetical protein